MLRSWRFPWRSLSVRVLSSRCDACVFCQEFQRVACRQRVSVTLFHSPCREWLSISACSYAFRTALLRRGWPSLSVCTHSFSSESVISMVFLMVAVKVFSHSRVHQDGRSLCASNRYFRKLIVLWSVQRTAIFNGGHNIRRFSTTDDQW